MLKNLFGTKSTPDKLPNIHLYNTETTSLELFEPLSNKEVKMYSCGPTVYDYVHIGNLRSFVFADIVKRTLIYHGYDINHTINLTDFGHLTDDGDAGWEVVKSRRQRRQRAYQNEACVIAVAINNVPEMRPQRKGSMPLKPDRCRQSSYASKLQYGRRNPKSSTSCTINSEIPTLASQTYKGSKKEMVSRMKKK